MARITVSNQSAIQFQIQKALDRKMNKVFTGAKELLLKQANVYKETFANSKEYQDIKGKLVGQFGFTQDEVAGLDKILELMLPTGNDITISFVDTAGTAKFMILEWVDFEKLKTHPFAQHELTKLDSTGSVIGITDIVSWVEWLEEGETIKGYEFFKPNINNAARSRSGEGLMRKDTGGVFVLEPTRIFEKIAQEANINVLKKGFGLLVKRFGKE